MDYIDRFKDIYGKEPSGYSFCPYRVCPIGAHSDHQLGHISGFAIDKGVHIAYDIKHNGVVELVSMQFKKRAQFSVNNVPEIKEGDWADYLRGATLILSRKHPLKYGISGVITGDLPIGGLSSSASITLAYLKAICMVNDIVLDPEEMIDISEECENKYVGVSSGRLDQSCEIYGRRDGLFYMDFKTKEKRLIPNHKDMPKFKIAVFFSGLEHNLASSKFNMRVDEVKSAAYSLMAYSGMEYGKFKDTYLRDVPRDIFESYKDKLPLNFKKRADHFYTEFDRVALGIKLWEKGDLEGFGKLIFESGKSSIESWETGSPELIELYNIMCETDGIYGGRFSGAGFKGCAIALINPDYMESIEKIVTEKYLKAFPEHSDKFKVYFCDTEDGIL